MLARLAYTEGAHASILFVLIVVVIAYNYGITYSLGDKTAYGGEEQMVGLMEDTFGKSFLSVIACRFFTFSKCCIYSRMTHSFGFVHRSLAATENKEKTKQLIDNRQIVHVYFFFVRTSLELFYI